MKDKLLFNNKSVNILFLGGAKRVSLGEIFLNTGEELGIKVNIFSYELERCVPISAIAKKIIVGLHWGDEKVVTHLLEIVKKYDINIILPFVDSAITIAAKQTIINKNIFVPVSDKSICELFFDKTKANRWFIKNGFNVPDYSGELPLIAKKRKGSASKGIFIIRTEKERRFFLDTFKKDEYLVQQFIEGEEYSIDCYVSKIGRILSVVPRKRIEIRDGEVTKCLTVKDNNIIKLATRVLVKSKCQGPVTIQVIKEKNTKKLFIIEINPRFGGGVIASIQAGANFPGMLLKDYLGIANFSINNWQNKLVMTRAYREFFYANNN